MHQLILRLLRKSPGLLSLGLGHLSLGWGLLSLGFVIISFCLGLLSLGYGLLSLVLGRMMLILRLQSQGRMRLSLGQMYQLIQLIHLFKLIHHKLIPQVLMNPKRPNIKSK